MSECNGNCSSCSQNCQSKEQNLKENANINSNIKNVIAVISGKGGVGKSTVSSLVASALNKKGYSVGILDADITGPSIPKSFGIKARAMQTELGIMPAVTDSGIKIMSVNMMLQNADDPVIWRGPVIAGAVKQFWTDVCWGDLDYLIIDCPPGTGDVPLTVFQSIPVDSAIIVTSPQDLVSLIVKKAYNMAKLMNIKVLGIVENMSYFVCPDCGKRHRIFGGGSESIADELGIPMLCSLPIDPSFTAMVDSGMVYRYDSPDMEKVVSALEGK
ncbi:MAG: Mrp/NBP35 family ATP-binding protein [Clostridia bacterium]|nr:Mrp/NBP35 family ATP-binding protein [Clostridia bacterium]